MTEMIAKAARLAVLSSLVVALLATMPVPASIGAEGESEDLPIQLQEELEAVLKEKAANLYEQKDERGLHFMRGTFSKKFHAVGNDYQVAFTADTAEGKRLKTERYLLTLTKNGGKWEISEEVLQDTYENLIRSMPGDEKFFRFDSVRIDAEGMKVSANNGTMFQDFRDDQLAWLVFSSDDLRYKYSPPADLNYAEAKRYRMMVERFPEDFEFTPQLVAINCDAKTCQEFLDNNFKGLEPSTESSMHPGVREQYNEARKDEMDAREKSVFSGFGLPFEDGRKLYKIYVKRKNRDKWIWLTYDNEAPWDVTFHVRDYGFLPIFGYLSEAAREAGVKPYDVELREDQDALDFEVESFKGVIEVALEEPELLRGDVEYVINVKRDRREIMFALNNFKGFDGKAKADRHPSITINSLQTGDGQDLTTVLTGGSSGLVVFPEIVKAGTRLTLNLSYESRGSIYKINPSYSAMDRGGWLPFLRITDKIDDFEMTIKSPSKYTMLGIGTKMWEKKEGDITVSHWKAYSPVSFPTIIFGDYYSVTPKIKAEKLDGTEIPVTIHVDTNAMAELGIRGKQLAPLAEQAVNAINLYQEIYGVDYPYGKLDLVADPLGALYGQAPPSIIYLGWAVFRGEGMLASAVGGDSSDTAKFLKEVVSHEVGHQWWGSLVGNANERNYWFIETLTEYASGLFVEAVASKQGKDPEAGWEAYMDKVRRWRKNVLDSDLMTSLQNASATYQGEDGFGDYIAAVYNKGPMALHTLRMTFGREKIDQFLRSLMQNYVNKEIVGRDLQLVAEEVFGGNMDWFFDQWVRGVGIPEYSFHYDYRKTEDGSFLVEGTVKQRVLVGRKKEELEGAAFRGVLPITVLGRDKQEYPVRLIIEGAEKQFRFKLPVEPLDIKLNKYNEMLAYDVLENRDW